MAWKQCYKVHAEKQKHLAGNSRQTRLLNKQGNKPFLVT